jgi:hypothetical protein
MRFKEKFKIFGKEIELLVDTGSEVSVIKKETAEMLGIKTIKEGIVELESGILGTKIIGERAYIPVELNGCKTDALITVADVRDEVIGADFLEQIAADIDMEKLKVMPRKCEPFKI